MTASDPDRSAASDPKRIDPANPPLEHLAIDPELGPPPEGYGGDADRRTPEDFDAPDSERTTGEVPDVEGDSRR